MALIPFAWPRALQGAPSQRLRGRDAERLAHYQALWDFYTGQHFPGRRRGRTDLVVNYARAIVDKHVAFLFARGVRWLVPALGLDAASEELAARTEATLQRLFEDAGLVRTLLQASTNASTLGDAVLKIMIGPITAAAGQQALRILNIDPSCFFPTFCSDDAAMLREVSVTSRVTPEEASERYGLALSRDGEQVETWTAAELRIAVGSTLVWVGENPYGFIPYLHVPNLAPPSSPWGVSDLEDVIPLNRELELRIGDQADVIRYHADPPVVFKGVREHSDLAVGPGTVWDVPEGAEVQLLEWRGQPPAVDHHIDRVMRALFDVSESPRSTFGDTEQAFSGVALETQLQPIVQRTLRRRIVWEPALRELARRALLLAELAKIDGAEPGSFAPYRTQIHWLPMLPRDDDAEARRYVELVNGGLRSRAGAMRAMGVSDPERELERMAAERRALEGALPS